MSHFHSEFNNPEGTGVDGTEHGLLLPLAKQPVWSIDPRWPDESVPSRLEYWKLTGQIVRRS